MKKILLVEDEITVVNFIKKGLTEEDFEVSVALDGNSGVEMALSGEFSLIILDIMLPDISGIEVCKKLRAGGITAPILFLTALNTAENVALGLNSGADDYLAKPFRFVELIARVNALLRRGSPQAMVIPETANDHTWQVGDLVVDDEAKTVSRDGMPIVLTATEYRLLLVLVKNRGKVLSRIDLLENVWDINYNLATNVVDVYINYLRKKIDLNREDKLIHTIIGMGYVLKEG
ncbi:MAG: response regulator transcription factor [Bacteroidota bacterium]